MDGRQGFMRFQRLPSRSEAELQHIVIPLEKRRLPFLKQSPQKQIPEVSQMTSVLKDCKAFEQQTSSAAPTALTKPM